MRAQKCCQVCSSLKIEFDQKFHQQTTALLLKMLEKNVQFCGMVEANHLRAQYIYKWKFSSIVLASLKLNLMGLLQRTTSSFCYINGFAFVWYFWQKDVHRLPYGLGDIVPKLYGIRILLARFNTYGLKWFYLPFVGLVWWTWTCVLLPCSDSIEPKIECQFQWNAIDKWRKSIVRYAVRNVWPI